MPNSEDPFWASIDYFVPTTLYFASGGDRGVDYYYVGKKSLFCNNSKRV